MFDPSHSNQYVEESAWQDRVTQSLGECYNQLARQVSGQDEFREMQFFLMKSRSRTLCLRIEVGQSKSFLKVFDGSDAATGKAYEREKSVLLTMRQSGLVTSLTAYNDAHRFLLMRYDSNCISELECGREKPLKVARRIGQWIARFDAAAPTSPASGNWFTYLSKMTKFGRYLDEEKLDNAYPILSQIPLCGLGLARNDGALHNFLVDQNGGLLGCDFEKATMRPRGWDYLLTYQALIQRFPDCSEPVLEAFSQGYASVHRGSLLVKELNTVAKILYCAQALAGHQNERFTTWL